MAGAKIETIGLKLLKRNINLLQLLGRFIFGGM